MYGWVGLGWVGSGWVGTKGLRTKIDQPRDIKQIGQLVLLAPGGSWTGQRYWPLDFGVTKEEECDEEGSPLRWQRRVLILRADAITLRQAS